MLRPIIALSALCLAAVSLSCGRTATVRGDGGSPLRLSLVSAQKDPPPGFTTPGGVYRECRYQVSVENVSGKVVRGYALRAETVAEAPSADTVYPDVGLQTLRPGESRAETFDLIVPAADVDVPPRLTVEYVNFGDGTAWGAKQEYDAFFVRQ